MKSKCKIDKRHPCLARENPEAPAKWRLEGPIVIQIQILGWHRSLGDSGECSEFRVLDK